MKKFLTILVIFGGLVGLIAIEIFANIYCFNCIETIPVFLGH